MHTKVAATTTAMVTASPSPSTIIGSMNDDDDEDMKLSCKNGVHSDQYQAIEPRDKSV